MAGFSPGHDVGVLAVTGVPPFSIFQSEFTILSGAFAAKHAWLAGLFVVCVVAIFAGFLNHVVQMNLGTPREVLLGVRRVEERRPLALDSGPGKGETRFLPVEEEVYDLDVASGGLAPMQTLTMPAIIQCAWPNRAQSLLYVATSHAGAPVSRRRSTPIPACGRSWRTPSA